MDSRRWQFTLTLTARLNEPLFPLGPSTALLGRFKSKKPRRKLSRALASICLIVCGFAFDPHVSEEAKRYGKLNVIPVEMNPDLAMGDELLKKTGAGNLFMYFGEPDIDIKKQKDGKFVAEIKGLDVYDPTTGRSARRPLTTSPAGSSTRTTTAKASLSATRTSPALKNPTRNSNVRYALKLTRRRGPLSTPRKAFPSTARRLAKSPSRLSTITVTKF